jgi:hypothetical protein
MLDSIKKGIITLIIMSYATVAIADDMIMIIRMKFLDSTPENGHVIFKSDYPKVINLGNDAYLSWETNDKSLNDVKILVNGSVISSDKKGTYATRPTKDALINVALFDVTASKVVESHDHQIKVSAPPSIDSFTADKTAVAAGEQINLTWSGKNIESSSISPSVTVTGKNSASTIVNEVTTFILTVTNELGNTTTKSLTVDVVADAPQVKSFTTGVSSVYKGDSLVFNWDVVNADYASLYVDGQWYQNLPLSGSKDIIMQTVGNQTPSIRGVVAATGDTGTYASLDIEVLDSIDWNIKPRLENPHSAKLGEKIGVVWEMGPTLRDIKVKYQTNVDSSWQDFPIDAASGVLSYRVSDPNLRLINFRFVGERLNGQTIDEFVVASVVNVEINAADAAVDSSVLMNVESGKAESLYVYNNNIFMKKISNGVNFVDIKYSGSNKLDVRLTPEESSVIFSFDVYGLPDWVVKPSASHAIALPGESIELSWTAISPFKKVSITKSSSLGSSVFDNLDLSAAASDNKFKTSLIDGESYAKYRVTAHAASGSTIFHDVYVYTNNVKLKSDSVSFGSPLVFDVTMGIGDIAFYIDGKKYKQVSSSGQAMTVSLDAVPIGMHDLRVVSLSSLTGNKSAWTGNAEVFSSEVPSIKSDYYFVPVGGDINVSWFAPDGYTNYRIYAIPDGGTERSISNKKSGTFAYKMENVNMIAFYIEAKKPDGTIVTKYYRVYQTESKLVNTNVESGDLVGVASKKYFTTSTTLSIFVNDALASKVVNTAGNGVVKTTYIDRSYFPTPGIYAIKVLEETSAVANFMPQYLSVEIIEKVDTGLNQANYTLLPSGEDVTYSWEMPSKYTSFRVSYREDGVEKQVVSTQGYGSFTTANNTKNQNAELYINATTDSGYVKTTRLQSFAYDASVNKTLISSKESVVVSHRSYSSLYSSFNIYINGVKVVGATKNAQSYLAYSMFKKGMNEVRVESSVLSTRHKPYVVNIEAI